MESLRNLLAFLRSSISRPTSISLLLSLALGCAASRGTISNIQSLTLQRDSSSQVTAAWTSDSLNVEGFAISYAVAPATPDTRQPQLLTAGPVLTSAIPGLAPNTTYNITVCSHRSDHYSGVCQTAQITTFPLCDASIAGNLTFTQVQTQLTGAQDQNADGIIAVCLGNGSTFHTTNSGQGPRIDIPQNNMFLYAERGHAVSFTNSRVDAGATERSVFFINGKQNISFENLSITDTQSLSTSFDFTNAATGSLRNLTIATGVAAVSVRVNSHLDTIQNITVTQSQYGLYCEDAQVDLLQDTTTSSGIFAGVGLYAFACSIDIVKNAAFTAQSHQGAVIDDATNIDALENVTFNCGTSPDPCVLVKADSHIESMHAVSITNSSTALSIESGASLGAVSESEFVGGTGMEIKNTDTAIESITSSTFNSSGSALVLNDNATLHTFQANTLIDGDLSFSNFAPTTFDSITGLSSDLTMLGASMHSITQSSLHFISLSNATITQLTDVNIPYGIDLEGNSHITTIDGLISTGYEGSYGAIALVSAGVAAIPTIGVIKNSQLTSIGNSSANIFICGGVVQEVSDTLLVSRGEENTAVWMWPACGTYGRIEKMARVVMKRDATAATDAWAIAGAGSSDTAHFRSANFSDIVVCNAATTARRWEENSHCQGSALCGLLGDFSGGYYPATFPTVHKPSDGTNFFGAQTFPFALPFTLGTAMGGAVASQNITFGGTCAN